MIKILNCEWKDNYLIYLEFSDGVQGYFDLQDYLSTRQGPLLESLRDSEFARRCFVDAGALCWPHGLELSPERLHDEYLLKEVVA
ncbi:MAG TPA: DUF2442 domain-containing protein [Pelovirga sp.]|nr:DUF2442 domain-containing protein [Pelovirga sp.]